MLKESVVSYSTNKSEAPWYGNICIDYNLHTTDRDYRRIWWCDEVVLSKNGHVIFLRLQTFLPLILQLHDIDENYWQFPGLHGGVKISGIKAFSWILWKAASKQNGFFLSAWCIWSLNVTRLTSKRLLPSIFNNVHSRVLEEQSISMGSTQHMKINYHAIEYGSLVGSARTALRCVCVCANTQYLTTWGLFVLALTRSCA